MPGRQNRTWTFRVTDTAQDVILQAMRVRNRRDSRNTFGAIDIQRLLQLFRAGPIMQRRAPWGLRSGRPARPSADAGNPEISRMFNRAHSFRRPPTSSKPRRVGLLTTLVGASLLVAGCGSPGNP